VKTPAATADPTGVNPAGRVGSVHSFDVSTGVDGPRTRFVAFLAGCPLRCRYCHSPDTWYGRNGRPTTVDELVTEIRRYERFIKVAGGGVTLSGGEPLQQARFAEAVLRGCKDLGLHTALDTSGYLGDRAGPGLLDATDLVLLDIKSWDPATYRRITGTGEVGPTLRFARRLAERGTPIWLRFVLVPGLTDDPANIAGIARFAASLPTVERVEVLPFHRLGAQKYERLGLPYPCAGTSPPTSAALRAAREEFRAHGVTAY
jgi:pyruvate formate lyase activating enzyme